MEVPLPDVQPVPPEEKKTYFYFFHFALLFAEELKQTKRTPQTQVVLSMHKIVAFQQENVFPASHNCIQPNDIVSEYLPEENPASNPSEGLPASSL